MVVQKRRNETSVTRLSRDMVRDYMKEKRNVRHSTPDLGSRRVCYNDGKAAPEKEDDLLVLDEDTEERENRLEFKFVPKFRSAMNTPYQSRERE
jgi:hypothetical protein